MESIHALAFFEASKLTLVTIPATVTGINNEAFSRSALKTVYISDITTFNTNNTTAFQYNTSAQFYGATSVTITTGFGTDYELPSKINNKTIYLRNFHPDETISSQIEAIQKNNSFEFLDSAINYNDLNDINKEFIITKDPETTPLCALVFYYNEGYNLTYFTRDGFKSYGASDSGDVTFFILYDTN